MPAPQTPASQRDAVPPPPHHFRQLLDVETPEHVVLGLEIAGIGSRTLAALIDTALLGAWSILLAFMMALLRDLVQAGAVLTAGLFLLYFLSLYGYFVFYEGLRDGQTPGKRRVGIRVVRDTGHPVTLGAAAVRNLLRIADALPPPYLLGGLLVAFHPRAKRLGDLVAGTVVVRDRPEEIPEEAPSEVELLAAPELDDQRFALLQRFRDRAADLPAESRRRLAAELAGRFADVPRHPAASDEAFLRELHRAESARRRGGLAGGAGGSAVGERFVARKRARWDEFGRLAARASREGLDGLAAPELPGFAERYREIAADLARARTYGVPPGWLARLERLVAAGHNALYRDQRRTGRAVGRFLLRDCPAAVVRARGYVLAACLAFALPAAAGFMLLRDRPALAAELLPDVMLRRAEAGAERVAEGRKYVTVDAELRPMLASALIANNVQVALTCFAGGIFFGLGAFVLLAYNGLSLGAATGHFVNSGLLGYLLEFVVGHGLLELFAIWVAGAAGFLLGRALVAPGDLTRGEALVQSGALAVRMIAASALLLLFAGLIEGFLSAGEQDAGYRVAVSGASGVFLVLYLWNGWRASRGAAA